MVTSILKKEALKRPLRKVVHPFYLRLINKYLARRYAKSISLPVDQWFWGSRGMARTRMHQRVLNFMGSLAGKSVLVVGCGRGADAALWLKHSPSRLVGIDFLDYQADWNNLIQQHQNGSTALSFYQADVSDFKSDFKFDLIVSDAVFEHLYHFEACLQNIAALLAPKGLLYATYGPLWHTWGGDHISGYDTLQNGFNHLILKEDKYWPYLNKAGPFDTPEDDGRTWIKEKLFSYLKAEDYIHHFNQLCLNRLFLGVEISPEAERCLKRYPEVKQRLLDQYDQSDLVIKGMSIIYQS